MRPQACSSCGRPYEHVTGFVYEDGHAHAVYYAACHGHPGHDAWIDVVVGTWGDADAGDHVTFSAQLRQEGAMAVDAPVAAKGESDVFGRLLTRDEALAHPLISDFWSVVDLLAAEDPAVVAHVYGTPPREP